MRRFLLAMPLFLVISLSFVQLPNVNSGSSNNSVSTQNSSRSAVTVSPSNKASISNASVPQSVEKSKKTQLASKSIKGNEEGNENEGGEGDD